MSGRSNNVRYMRFIKPAVIAVMAFYFYSSHTLLADDKGYQSNGEMTVWVIEKNKKQKIGSLEYSKYVTEQSIDISELKLCGNIKILVTNEGDTAAHIDAVSIDNHPPVFVEGTKEERVLALKKLSAKNNDLIDAKKKQLLFDFTIPSCAQKISLSARIEPVRIGKYPAKFPAENNYKPIGSRSKFYNYSLYSHTGKIDIQKTADEKLLKPFFKVFVKTGSGHPSDYTYGWISNDKKNLYVIIDFVPDNTLDEGEEDYAKVHINTPKGVKSFVITGGSSNKWGMSKFLYTVRSSYQHRVYEFVIPLLSIGAKIAKSIQIAFESYGTVALPVPPNPNPPLPPLLPPSLPDGGDPVDTD